MKNGGGHFAPKLGGHFELESGGHFKLELGGQYHWNLHLWLQYSLFQKIPFYHHETLSTQYFGLEQFSFVREK
jgi:hypothetical protein